MTGQRLRTTKRFAPALMIGTMLAGVPAMAQMPAPIASPVPAPAAAAAPAAPTGTGIIHSISVSGNQRLEADTVRSYIKLKPGDAFSRELLDQALKDLYASELFADVQIAGATTGDIVLQVRENPVINRIVLEGNKRIKEEKIRPEIKLAPRQIFTRSKARADVARIIELYKRQGRYAATVEPKMVLLDQNRVDIVFEIHEGAKSKVRAINIIGNKKFAAGRLRGEMVTRTSGLTHLFSGGTSYDPDRLAYDQQKLRQFYLTNGYADFHVVSAVAELTPDKKDFIVTYVVEEGERYKFGDVDIKSDIRDLKADDIRYLVNIKKGAWYNAKMVEDTVDRLTEAAGLLGYAFADVRPNFERNKDTHTMSVTFRLGDAPRVYVERIDINGNTITRDKVVRREFRLAEGDAFNGFRVKRSRDRIQSLGFFQDKMEIDQKQGSSPDKVILTANVEEKSTGQLQVSAGYSSLEKFIVSLSIAQSNFMGKGQEVRASVDYSIYSKSIDVGFTEPYLFDHNIAVGVDVFRRDYNSFNYVNTDRNTTYQQVTTGFQVRSGVPLTEFWSLALRYGLSQDNVSLDKSTFYSSFLPDGTETPGIFRCDPLLAGRYLCDSIGKKTISSAGYSLVYDNLNDRIRPTRGERLIFSQDFAGLGGNVRYIRSRGEGHKYWGLAGFILSANGEAGYVLPLSKDPGAGVDKVRLTDRFFLGSPDFAGFDIRGIGPRVLRRPFLADGTVDPDRKNAADDALGGRAYYFGKLELQIPLGNGAKELGLRPSLFANIGSVFGVKKPPNTATFADIDGDGIPDPLTREIHSSDGSRICLGNDGSTTTVAPTATCVNGTPYTSSVTPFYEEFLGNTWKPRISVGIGVNWNSPFGPFRIDVAKALVTRKGDDPKLFSFNVGTQF
jgi:outer membrane protein insertion porin family